MPNIKSAIKRVRITKVKTLKNVVRKSALKTILKKCKESIAKNEENSAVNYKKAVVALDKAVSKNLMHKNTAARRKSKLTKALKTAQAK